jgi:hypothetical protein
MIRIEVRLGRLDGEGGYEAGWGRENAEACARRRRNEGERRCELRGARSGILSAADFANAQKSYDCTKKLLQMHEKAKEIYFRSYKVSSNICTS